MMQQSRLLRIVQPMRRPMNYQMEKSSPLEMLDSDALNIYSNPSKWMVKNSPQSKNWPINQSKNVMLMSEEISIKTSSCQVVPPCLKALVKDSSKKLNQEHLNPSMLKLLPVLIEDSLSGEVVQPLPHWVPSLVCGSPRKTMTNTEQPLSIENVSEQLCPNVIIKVLKLNECV